MDCPHEACERENIPAKQVDIPAPSQFSVTFSTSFKSKTKCT